MINFLKSLFGFGSPCGNRTWPGGTMKASAWYVGANGKDKGIARHPRQEGNGFVLEIPGPTRDAGKLGYVTFKHGSLRGMSQIYLRWRVEKAEGARILATDSDDAGGTVSLYFQRKGDNWTGKKGKQFYRWWSANVDLSTAPSGALVVDLIPARWTHVYGESDAAEFAAAIENACCVGFTFGGGGNAGHGVFAIGSTRIIVEEFRVS